MAQQNVQINLQFNANVKQAQQQMKSLQTQLSQLATSQPNTPFSLTPQLKEAQKSAMDLKMALNNAMNVDTGKLNLNKFQSELNRSGKSIQQYAQQLQTLGPAGVKAFQQVAQAVAQADTKMINLSGGAKKLMDTLGNTVRWQLTSSAIHGVMNAISGTLSYAKELDTSLNNIRIVTGKSADQMARFAKEANKMAKELSTTTTKYTDASLIYYQQGLNDKAVKERTDATVKLANVAGRSAQEVSEWMTAIWNNFDDGSESLEYYADVITKLGASTASSADEIATGLEKFAAVAETVGLSYEYATSALATVTAETRQSAEVVGTAFKTLFARMEGLKLGETLEDGTDLNQYSLALEKVGINIKDANGELKDMDTILDQTGARWSTLNKDQQVALAQSVAGIRQYNQFMALMDNWDVMQKNLELTEQANGALDEQNRIYEESMKASQERMKAAAEELKALLIGGEDLAPLYDFAGRTLEVITELLEAFGGLKTILLGVAVAITKLYQPQVASFMSQMVTGLTSMGSSVANGLSGKGFSATNTFKTDTATTAAKMAASSLPEGTAQSQFTKDMSGIDMARIENEGRLSEAVKQRIAWLREELAMKQELVLRGHEELEVAEQAVEAQRQALVNQPTISSSGVNEVQKVSVSVGSAKAHGDIAESMATQAVNMGGNMTADSRHEFSAEMGNQLTAMQTQLSKVDGAVDELGPSFQDITDDLNTFVETGKGIETILQKIKELNSELARVGEQAIDSTIAEVAQDSAGSSVNATHQTLSSMENIGENASIDTSMATINAVDTSSLSEAGKAEIDVLEKKGKALQDEAKLLKDKDKWIAKNCKGMKSATKMEAKYKAAVQKNQKEIKAFNKQASNTAKTLKKNDKTLKTAVKNNDKYENSVNDTSKELKDFSKKSEDAAKSSTSLGEAQRGLGKEADDLRDKIENGGNGLTHWSDKVAGAMSAMAQMGMGVNMLTSSFSQLSESIASGEFTWSDLLSSMTSILFALPMLVNGYKNLGDQIGLTDKIQQLFTKSKKASKAATDAEIVSTQAEIALAPADQAADIASANAENVETGAEIAGAAAGVAEQIGSGPPGWVTAAASIAMMAPLLLIAGGAMIGGIASGSAKGTKEAEEKEVSKGAETLEAIEENQELAESVNDLTSEYKALRDAGESTADVLEDMRDKIPELIDNYKELAKTMGTHIDTSNLEDAYEAFLKTGDISLFEKAQADVDAQIEQTQKSTAETTVQGATKQMIDSAREGRGRLDGDTYHIDLGEPSAEIDKELEEIFGDMWDGDNVRFDSTNSAEVLNYYEKAIKARDRLKELGQEDTATYKRLADDVKEMAEYAENAYTAQNSKYKVLEKELLALEKEGLDSISLSGGITADSITTLEEYEKHHDDIIEKLVEEYEMTEAQAQAYIEATDTLGTFAEASKFFSEGGLGFNSAASLEEVQKIKEWFADLPEDQRTLAMTIDYTLVANLDDAKAALEEAKEKARIAAATEEAVNNGADADTFKTYAEILQATNSHLKDNKAAAYEVAAANVRVNKGLEDLSKNWSDNLKKITKNTKGSYEYAEGIAEITKSLETMFGVKPSVNFVETHLQDIENMLNGDKQAFEELQNEMSKDYVQHMQIEPEIVFDGNTEAIWHSAEEIQNAMQGALDELGDLEIGENVVLSEKYTKVLQDALDAGQITQQQLEEAFRIKGYDLTFDTKKVPGPKTHYKRTYDVPLVGPVVVEYDEETEMTVPLINGADANVNSSGGDSGGGATLTATRTADSTSINPTTTQDNADKKQDRIDDLDDELDRYHEINEVISDTERKLDKLGRAKDRAFGASKIALMEQEIAAQKELIKNNETLLEEAENNYEIDRKDLLDNYAVELDKDGRITNYQDIQQQYIDKLTAAAGNEDLYNEINEEYEAFKDAASKYEESLNKVEETAENLDSQLDELYDKNLSLIEYKVQIKVDIADDDQAYIDFLMQKTEDDAFAAAENIGFLGESAQNTLDKIAATQDGIKDVERALAAGEITPEQAAEKLRTYRQDLIDYNADLLEIRNSVQEKLTEAYDAWNEKMDTNSAKIEHLSSVTDSYRNIIDIVGKDTLGMSDEAMKKLTDAQVKNANNALKASKAKLDANEAFLKDLQQKRADAVAKYGEDSDEVADWDEQIEYAEEQVMSAKEEFMGSWETALTAAADAFQQHVEQIVETFSESMGGVYKNLEELQEAFDRQTEVNDRYLQQYEKTYEISKLNRSIQDSIDKTDNVASQKEMRKLQQELLDMQADGVNVSKRDIEYMQKKYDLLVAEQALKDAQNAKSVVRLTRDSEGNFGYTYTADQDSVDKAQQNYEDKLYAMQQFGDESLREIQEQILATNQEFKEALEAIAADETLSLEEKEAKVAEVTEYYTGKLRYWTEEADKFMQHGHEMNTEYNAGMAENFNETLLGKMYPDLTSFEGYYTAGFEAMDQAGSDFTEALEGYQGRIDTAFQLAGEDVSTFAEDVAGEGGYLDQVNGKSDEAGEEAERLAERMKEALTGEDGATNAIAEFYEEYAQKMADARSETDDTISKINELIQKYNELAGAESNSGGSGIGGSGDKSGSGSGTVGGSVTGGGSGSVTPTPTGATTSNNTTPKDTNKITGKKTVGGQDYYQMNGKWYNEWAFGDAKSPGIQKDPTVGDIGTIRTKDGKEINKSQYEVSQGLLNQAAKFDSTYKDKTVEITGSGKIKIYDGILYNAKGTTEIDNPKNYDPNVTALGAAVRDGKLWINIKDPGALFRSKFNNGNNCWVPSSNITYKNKPLSLDTGGYTGDWGPEGRMAMLHQKEIVLNAHDTENFLLAIEMVRGISNRLDQQASIMGIGLQNIIAQSTIPNIGGDTLQQEVHITAEFPNATDHNEIEEAFRNLTNLASQYANRK